MAMEYVGSSVTTTKQETLENDRVWSEMKLLQSIVVQSSLGQTVLRLVDNFLWTVEKCAEWSLPCQEEIVAGDENGKASGKLELVRPLPWILFLPSLVILRTIRMTMNVGAFITGCSQVTPSGIVKFVQLNRRRLNDIRNSGTREKRDKDEKLSMYEARRALIKSIRLTLSSLSCLDTSKPTPSPPPTKIHISSVFDPDAVTTTSEEKSVTESTDDAEKPRNLITASDSEEDEKEMEDEQEEKETLEEKIDRLALESSDEDEDFNPANCSVSSNESHDESNKDDDDGVDVDDGDVDDGDVSSTELRDIIEDASVLLDNVAKAKKEIEQFQVAERAAYAQASDQRSSAEKSRDKVEKRLSQRIDLPTCYTPDRSSQEGDPIFYSPISSDSDTPKAPIAEKCVSARDSLKTNEYVNGEIHFISASMISESKTSQGANNGVVVEKRSTNVSKYHKGKRTSHGNRRKK